MARIPEGRPVTLGGGGRNGDLLPVEPNAPWVLTHTELGWSPAMVDGKAWWIPTLKPMVIAGGLFGTKPGVEPDDPPQHRFAVNKMRDRKIARVVLESQVGEYLLQVECKGPRSGRKGLFFYDRWEKPAVVGGEYDPTYDTAGYHAWCLSLVHRGIIDPPNPRVLERIRDRLRGHLNRIGSLASTPSVLAKHDAEKGLVGLATEAALPDEIDELIAKERTTRRPKGASPKGKAATLGDGE